MSLFTNLVYFLVALTTLVKSVPVIMKLRIPSEVDIRDDVTLTCQFNLRDDKLYSVKWYKNSNEFYRYMPGFEPHKQSFPVEGVTLVNERCNIENVRLTRLSLNSSGVYSCEVSAEGPSFSSAADKKNMTVIALPREDPFIEGISNSYAIGDVVTANCTSPRTYPPPVLTWFINDKIVEFPAKVSQVNERKDAMGLTTRTSSLEFFAESYHFSGPRGGMEVRCTVSVRGQHRSTLATPVLRYRGSAQEQVENSAPLVLTSEHLSWILMLILRILMAS